MILVEWPDGTVVGVDGDGVIALVESDVYRRAQKLLSKPAMAQRSIVTDEGIEERRVRLAPGDPGHALAALSIPGSKILAND